MNTTTEGGPIRWIVEAAFRRPALVLLGAALGALLGWRSFRDLPRDVFPDLSTPVFSVIVQNAAMGAEELEANIGIPLEQALAGLPEVRRIRGTHQLGVSQVVVEFEPQADVIRARQLVAERVAQVSWPVGTEPPLLSSLTGRLNEIFEFTLEAEAGSADLMTLRDLAEFDVRSRLLAVPGVAAVERLGGYLREFQIQIDPERMGARGVTLDEVMHAARGANRNAAGGLVTTGPTEWTVRAVGQVHGIDELRNTVVALRGPVPVLLGDIADVVEAPAVRRGIAHRLAGEVVSCRVSKQFGADTVAVSAGLRAALAELKGTLPVGVSLRIVYDQSELVQESLSGVGRAVGIGALFVVIVIVALLGDLRAAALVTLTLPLSLLFAGIALERFGIGLNTMTLGGLAIATGLLVDASIIVCENIVHRYSEDPGGMRIPIAREAAIEVGGPIAAATAIVVAVFLPLLAMEGLEGRTYRPLAAAVIAAMAAALIVALTFTPVVSGWLLRGRPSEKLDNGLIRLAKLVYGPLLDLSLRAPILVVGLAALTLVPTALCAGWLGRDFMPELNEGSLLLQTFLPAEASLDEVDRLNHRVEDELREIPEIAEVVRRTGRAERTEDPMPHTVSDVLILLKPDRERSMEEIEAEIRDRLSHVAAVSSSLTTPLGMRIDEGLGGTPADVSVKIFGADLAILGSLGEAAKERLEGLPGLEDLRVEALSGLPQIQVVVDRSATARAGLTPGDVIEALQIGLVGETVSEVRVGQRRYDLVVKLHPDHHDGIAALGALRVDGHDGAPIPLAKLATISTTTGPGVIRREAGSRRIAIDGSVAGADLATVAAGIDERLAGMAWPTGYFYEVGGKVEGQSRAASALLVAVAIAWVAVFALLTLALDSVRETVVVLAALPLALVGGVAALALSGGTWNVSSMVGLIGLFGIAVQNGLVLVTQARALEARGLPLAQALREASLGRVRPKLMTAGTAILGLLPLVVLDLPGTEIERPLAVVLVGGLVSSTLFTLFVLPAGFLLFAGRRR
jgi:cobalt-zinc-cadmium resistance protein CzcA